MWFQDLLQRSTDAIDAFKGKTQTLLKKWSFDLNAAGSQTINISGNFIYVVDATDGIATIGVQFSRLDSDIDSFTLSKGLGIIHPFDKLYVSWSAQTSKTLTIWIGNLAPELLNVIDNRSAVALDTLLTNIRDDQRATTGTAVAEQTINTTPEVNILAANTARVSFSVQAKDTNTHVVYVLYSTGVLSTKYKYILFPGAVLVDNKYRGAVYAIASAAGQLVGVQEEV